MTSIRSIDRFEYRAPGSLDETLDILKTSGTDAKVLAGGTDLILQMKQGLIRPSLVVDVKKVPELNRLEWDEVGGLHVGAVVPLNKLATFPAILERYNILAQACSVIGSAQVRNRGTMAGNICNAAPSADSAPALLCLGAGAVVASSNGARSIDLNDFFVAPGETAIGDGELMVEIEVPTPPPHSAGCYIRHTTREEMDIAVVGVASFLTLSPQDKTLKEARIALGAVAPTPVRAHGAEAFLTGKSVTPDIIEEVAEKAAAEANPISDLRGSAEYRRELVRVLVRRTLRESCSELGLIE
ncbi:MAG: xanthine dehydrogenase family protein subunit M [Dehalococcoidales bacterium]|nr:MAG: xanthine dehydrogenase family protein subunit M [Dehalococcoidales bacterium]